MAPDLNSVPASPRNGITSTSTTTASIPTTGARQSSTPASRRTSQIFPMSPPPLPLGSPGITASSAPHTFPPLSPNMTPQNAADTAGIPMRHPRPLTPAELHLEMEKEQEAAVNRLTRELTALRAHSASVASTASSTASGVPGLLLEATDPSAAHAGALTGPTHPTASRRHRSSSSLSRGSMSGGTPYTSNPTGRYSISSQPGTSETPSAMQRTPSTGLGIGPSLSLSSSRHEEVAHYRHELEEAKRENDALRRRIRELERALRSRRSESREQERGRSGLPPNTPSTAINTAATAAPPATETSSSDA